MMNKKNLVDLYAKNGKIDSDELRLSEAGTIVFFGRSGIGKTALCDQLIRERKYVFRHNLKSLFLVYGSWQQKTYGKWREIFKNDFRAHQGWSEGLSAQIFKGRNEKSELMLLILDDISHQITQKQFQEEILNMINVSATHNNTVIFLLSQQLIMGGSQGGVLRSITRNSSGIVLFENPLDGIALRTLSQNIFAGEKKPGTALASVLELNSIFNGRYLFIDLHATSPISTNACDITCKKKLLRLKSSFYTERVYKGEEKMRVYL